MGDGALVTTAVNEEIPLFLNAQEGGNAGERRDAKEKMSRERKRTCGEGEMWGAVREEGGRRGGPSGEEGLRVGGACGDQGTGRGREAEAERGGEGGGG
uniref:Uncharacterized protein n=1 Tax=Oryza sativa subsp. japonica TaxID=39947 RepID=Q5Z6J9_ORYSJ|nr:hypothetical protein [Oryza sativa Japonica Group]BAD68426.1 hypothetical protein [Oryza sativa Japonica Group]